MKKVYKIISENLNTTTLSNLSGIDYVEEVETGGTLYYPNDYYNTGAPQSNLELIRAPQAWNITQGNPNNTILAIYDSNFDINHEDLVNKITQHYEYCSSTTERHGTVVSSVAAGDTDNNLGLSSVGFKTKMITYENDSCASGFDDNTMLLISQIPGIKIINGSWYNRCSFSTIGAEVYKEIRMNGVLVIMAAGNGSTCGGPNNYIYPASYDHVMSISSVGHLYPPGLDHPTWGMMEWRDCHQVEYDPSTPDSHTHQHNDKVDLVVPGYNISVAANGNTYSTSWGTSVASPTVAGAAALILAVKPNLTPNQVENILKSTTDDIFWIPYNSPYIGKLGTGRLNVFRAVKTTECMDVLNPKLNLVVRDTKEDVGNNPNNQSTVFNKSENMWVRNQNDGRYNEVHQNVEYSATNPNYVYVRVTNYGCKTSSGNDEIRLYWSVVGTSQPWPSHWDASTLTGGPIGIKTIPALEPGQEAVIEFEWFSPDPDNYPGPISLSGNFSLLSRIISTDDPISYTIGTNINTYVKNNSNVAWKNILIVDISPLSPKTSTSLYVSNPSNETQSYSLEFAEQKNQEEKPLYEEAEIGIKLDETIYNAWTEGGSSSIDIDSTYQHNVKLLNDEDAVLANITLQPGEAGIVEFSLNFLTKELTERENYEYDIVQRNTSTGEIVGSVTILINKENRQAFIADAETTTIGNITTMTAEDIGEPAVYNWYDSDGNLIYSGTELIVSPEITKIYKLEIISDLDGFKDYKDVEVIRNSQFSLKNLIPNPANSQVTVSYEINSASSAYLTITNLASSSTNNYILDINTSQVILNLSSYPQGVYTVTLICNGAVVSSKNLIKN